MLEIPNPKDIFSSLLGLNFLLNHLSISPLNNALLTNFLLNSLFDTNTFYSTNLFLRDFLNPRIQRYTLRYTTLPQTLILQLTTLPQQLTQALPLQLNLTLDNTILRILKIETTPATILDLQNVTPPENIQIEKSKIENPDLSTGINEIETEQDKPSFGEKFQNSFFGLHFEGINAALDATSGILNSLSRNSSTYNGPKGHVRAAVDSGYNAIADAAAKFGPYGQVASMGMKAANMLNGVLGAIFGATDGMTTTDAILDSPLGFLSGVGWINQAFGKKSDTITKNEEAFALVGSAYGGSSANVDNALNYSGKKYGAFSSSARKDANMLIAESRRQQNMVEDIANEATTRSNLLNSMSAIASNRRAFNMLGGYNLPAIHVGKHGMVLTKDTTVDELCLDTDIEEVNLIEEFADGGVINELEIDDDIIDYIYDRFPILKNYEIYLLHDPNFNPREDVHEGGDIEYMTAEHDTLPYYNNYSKPDSLKGKSVIVYNDKVEPEDIALDMISHGLREHDPKWLRFLKQLGDEAVWHDRIKYGDLFDDFLIANKIDPKKYSKLPLSKKRKIEEKFEKTEINPERFASAQDALIRGILVKDDHRETYAPKEEYADLEDSFIWQLANEYLNSFNDPVKYKEGGSFNVIPDGALHARLHHMDNDENITKKGIPVVSENKNGELEQHAEIERDEIILRLSLTKRLEELAKEDTDKAAIEAGKLLVDEILNNTMDNTNLINTI